MCWSYKQRSARAHATGGNPFYVRELLASAQADGLAASAEMAADVAEPAPRAQGGGLAVELALAKVPSPRVTWPKRSRRPRATHVLHAAARFVRGGRRGTLKMAATWPWAAQITTAWQRTRPSRTPPDQHKTRTRKPARQRQPSTPVRGQGEIEARPAYRRHGRDAIRDHGDSQRIKVVSCALLSP